MPKAVLIVMQDVLFSQTLRHKLSHFGIKVFITETAVQALELLDMRKMDVVLLDVRVKPGRPVDPKMGGMGLKK